MFKTFIVILLAATMSVSTACAQEVTDYIKEGYLIANIKSITSIGMVKCEVSCYLVPNSKDFAEVYFQLGTNTDPTAYVNELININDLNQAIICDNVYTNGKTLKIDFGHISMEKDFKARLVIKENTSSLVYNLGLTGFNNPITMM